jgi:hypothetical protein
MKNTALTILFILVLGQLSYVGMPWWGLAPIAAVAGWLFPKGAANSFAAGFLGGFLLWLAAALWLDMANNGLLAGKIGALFSGQGRWQMLLLTGILGGLVAGLACLTGFWARVLFRQPEISS